MLGVWLCATATFAQLNTSDDWDLPGNPGLETKTITVSANDAAFGSASVTTVTNFGTDVYPVGSTLSLSATPATGYQFVNWTVGETVISTTATATYVMPDQNVSVTANFKPNKYTVTFVVDGETVQSEELDFGTAITAPADPEKTGYTFKGWDKAVDATVPASDVTYTAVFTVNSYEVKFTVEGEDYSKSTLEYGATITTPAEPTKTGHTFSGWTTDNTVPAHDVTYNGTWTVNMYNVTFNSDNGTENIVNTQEYGSVITAPADPEKTGYTFNGWSPSVTDATVPANDITFTALWNINSYKATFIIDGVESSSNIEYGAEITAPTNTSKEGYTFKGWSPAIDERMPANDVTYTAQYEVNKYTVTFVADGQNIYSESLEYGSVITAPDAPEKTGFNFDGWSPVVDATVPAHDVTYTAQYGTGAYKVTFMVDGNIYQSSSMDYGQTIVLPANDPQKTGYTFQGWENYTEGATVPAEDITYNAVWQINTYSLTLDLNYTSESQTTFMYNYDYNAAIPEVQNPEREGYTFDGWQPAIPTNMPAENVTYTAQWKINKYDAVFMADDKEYSKATFEYGALIVAPDGQPTKEGYTFNGWDFTAGETTMTAGDMTFNAQWTVNQYNVSFNVDGDITSSTLDYGTAITAPADPEKTGYTFTGWTPAIAATVPANDVTYTANFKINQYNVTFIVDGETVKSESLDYGTAITAPADPEKDGFVFDGWTPEVTTVPAEDITFTATWKDGKFSNIVIEDGTTYVIEEDKTLNAANVDITAATQTSPMTTIINDGEFNADKVTINLVIPNGQWSFIKFPCDVPVAELKNSQVGTSWQIRRYDAAARANAEFDNVWVTLTNDDVVKAGEGIIIQSRRDDSEVKTSTFSFTTENAEAAAKILNGKSADIALKANNSTYASNAGWNLVGNPYLTYFDTRFVSNSDAPIIVWEKNTYRAYSPSIDSYILSPFQAYFVQTAEDATVTFDAKGRQANAEVRANESKSRRISAINTAKIIDLSLTDGDNVDYTRIAVSDEASANYEIGLDAVKFMSMDTDVPQIYTTSEDTNYSINVRPADAGTFNLGFYFNKSGEFTINVENAGVEFAITDSESGEVIVLGGDTNSYTFTAEAGASAKRFIVNFDVAQATAINGVATAKQTNEIFTLQGVKVADMTQPGIYIVNGEKKIVK